MYTNPHSGLPMHPNQQPAPPYPQANPGMMTPQQQWEYQQQMQHMQQRSTQFNQQQNQFNQQFSQPQQSMSPQQMQWLHQQRAQQFNNQAQPSWQQQMGNNNETPRFGNPTFNNSFSKGTNDNSDRFGGGNTVQQPTQPQAPAFQPQPTELIVPQTPVGSLELVVSVVKHKHTSRSELTLTTCNTEVTVKDVNLKGLEESVLLEDTLEGIHGLLVGKVYEGEGKPKTLNLYAAVHNKSFHESSLGPILTEMYSLTPRDFFKSFRTLFNEVTDRYQYTVVEFLNDRLTEITNLYLEINTDTQASIDSFVLDFNDLLRVLADESDDIEEDFIDYLTDKLSCFADGDDLLTSVLDEADAPHPSSISELLTVAIVDKHLLETGLEYITEELTEIVRHPSNIFLLSVAELAGEHNEEFILGTLDGTLFRVLVAKDHKVYICKI